MADRFIVCHNPEQADRDAAVRERMLALLAEKIERSDALSKTKRAELRGKISTMPGLNRYLRVCWSPSAHRCRSSGSRLWTPSHPSGGRWLAG